MGLLRYQALLALTLEFQKFSLGHKTPPKQFQVSQILGLLIYLGQVKPRAECSPAGEFSSDAFPIQLQTGKGKIPTRLRELTWAQRVHLGM